MWWQKRHLLKNSKINSLSQSSLVHMCLWKISPNKGCFELFRLDNCKDHMRASMSLLVHVECCMKHQLNMKLI